MTSEARKKHPDDRSLRKGASVPTFRTNEEARAFLAAIVDSSDDAIVGKNLEGIVRSWNAGAERIFGYRADEMVGRSITTIIPPDRLAEEDMILSRIRRGERIAHYQTIRVTKDGREIHVSLTVSPIRDASGRLVGASKVARDVTERIRWEEALRADARRKDEFLATLAHELRNPLAPIRSSVDLLRLAGDRPDVQDRALDTLERQTDHLVRLVEDLLDVSRVTRGAITLRPTLVELATVVRSAVEAVQPLVEEKGHQLMVDLPPEPVLLHADPTRLAQVFSNLLDNAAKYTPPGGRIELRAGCEDKTLTVTVADTGPGIPPDLLEGVFEMFVQGEPQRRGGQSGLGIGLALVRSLVELHRGTVVARERPGGSGALFEVRLPVAEPRHDAVGTLDRRAAQPSGLRVLVVDDNRDAANSLRALLEAIGHETRAVYDGAAAAGVAEEQRPHLVLLDLGMPGVDGFEVARRLRRQPWGRDVRLVAVTGWGQESDRRRTFDAGFDHHLVKPVDLRRLEAILDELALGEAVADGRR